jgi:hypothetical protein
MKDLLITTWAVGRYKVYRELFEFAIKQAYPEYDVHVFESGIASPKYYGACIRFLLNPDVFRDYRYVYITDIDMMIVREPVSILDFHLSELSETGLCYSNTPRGMEERGFDRLTGLHFVTQYWFEKTKDARSNFLKKLCDNEIGEVAIHDELMLMDIVKESGLPVAPPKKDLICRHHGLHLGTVRAHKHETLQKLRRDVFIRVSVQRAKEWLKVVETPEYRSIIQDIKRRDKMAYDELCIMEKFTRQRSNEHG